MSTQNVKVARFARNVEWDFFSDFQTLFERQTSILPNFFIMKKHLDLSTRKKNPTQYLHLRSFAKFGKGLPRTTRLLKMDNKTQKSFSNWLFKINFYRAATKPIFSAQDDVNLQHMSLAIIISACPSSRRLRHENGSPERRSWSRRSLTRERKSTWWIA